MAQEIIIFKGKAHLDFKYQLRQAIKSTEHFTGLCLSTFEIWIMRELVKQSMQICLNSGDSKYLDRVVPFVEATRSFLLFVYDIDITETEGDKMDRLFEIDNDPHSSPNSSSRVKEWFKKRQSEIFPL
jgi:hypothetical protein